jgi:hypothetical protein
MYRPEIRNGVGAKPLWMREPCHPGIIPVPGYRFINAGSPKQRLRFVPIHIGVPRRKKGRKWSRCSEPTNSRTVIEIGIIIKRKSGNTG